ncbi:MAG TPA: DUF434 domain-containing protein [Polyangiaceae bacterium]|nr:DUF434 domain-containing protein [Polyangiaceae bacterium]
MPDARRHRGAHPRDPELFAPSELPGLTRAVDDFSWLLGRGYAVDAALKLVGDRHRLVVRQRVAVSRAACSDAARQRRSARRLGANDIAARSLGVDAFNAIITLEVALGGGLGVIGRDGARRDLASVHGSYRRVLDTPRALELLVSALAACAPAEVLWYLDRPVSNSGKLAGLLRAECRRGALPGSVELIDDVDRRVSRAEVALSADSAVLDDAEHWFDLGGWVVRERVPEAWTLDFSAPSEPERGSPPA